MHRTYTRTKNISPPSQSLHSLIRTFPCFHAWVRSCSGVVLLGVQKKTVLFLLECMARELGALLLKVFKRVVDS